MFKWIDPIVNQIAAHADDILELQLGFLCIVTTIFLWLWHSNRKKYNNLKHAIPADVVKSYLDSIIMNSTSLKSQLFRGGGLDVGGVPSVIPLGNLMGGDNLAVSGAPSTALLEELNQRKAQVAALEAQLSSSLNSFRELEAKLNQSQSALAAAEAKIKELEALLAQNRSAGGGDAALKSELNMVTKERDELRDRLREFEIIADDLANLKRLQQENEQLKKSLGMQGGSVAAIPAPAPEAVKAVVNDLFEEFTANEVKSNDNKELEDFLPAPTDSGTDDFDAAAALMAEEIAPSEEPVQAAAVDDKPKAEKTPEDLLSEFEKMLG